MTKREGLIKKFQMLELKRFGIEYTESMSYDDARNLIEAYLKKPQEKKGLSKEIRPTDWKETVGVVVDVGPNRAVECDLGLYYIGSYEKNASGIKTGAKVKCRVGHPGQHRGIAINLEEI